MTILFIQESNGKLLYTPKGSFKVVHEGKPFDSSPVSYWPSEKTTKANSLEQIIDYTVAQMTSSLKAIQDNMYDWKNVIELKPKQPVDKFNTCSDCLDNLLLKGKLK